MLRQVHLLQPGRPSACNCSMGMECSVWWSPWLCSAWLAKLLEGLEDQSASLLHCFNNVLLCNKTGQHPWLWDHAVSQLH